MDQLLYGVAYYDEYMPCDRLDKDIEMMKEAGINVVRIAESTWSTLEPRPGVFDYSHIDRVTDAMYQAGIHVIIGTPTYAIPSWLEKMHPDIMADTIQGRRPYGARQIMDITSPAYRFYGERVIRKLIGHVADHPAVIGYQLDNETKYYGTAGNNVQRMFVRYLRDKFGTTDALNEAFGRDYWSNRIDAWEDVPDVRGTINGSLGAEFEKFQRSLVTEFLQWQSDIVSEYKRADQFITHNFDYNWKGYSNGVQPDVDHLDAAKALTVAGCDIYHPTQDHLTGIEIAMHGDLCRSLKYAPYLVLETEAQGFPQWTPYPGQLYLQAMSHLASGAEMVEYWHWHSIHNSIETYWKGLLSHDFKPNAVYQEAKTVGRDFKALSPLLTGLHKENRAAILVSNEALTALKWFPISKDFGYNDVVRMIYESFFRMNVGVDFIFPQNLEKIRDYDLVAVPALYAASDEMLRTLDDYVKEGGHLLITFKSGFTNEHVKVYHDNTPHILCNCCGVSYSEFTHPEQVSLSGFELPERDRAVSTWMELLMPEAGTEVLSRYEHPYWKDYAAVTKNHYGNGTAFYLGCRPTQAFLDQFMELVLRDAGLYCEEKANAPVVIRESKNEQGETIRFFLNYSMEEKTVPSLAGGRDPLNGERVPANGAFSLHPWGCRILVADR